MIDITPYRAEHYAGVDTRWQTAFPDDPAWNRAAVAVPAKLAVQPELFLIATDGALVTGSTWPASRLPPPSPVAFPRVARPAGFQFALRFGRHETVHDESSENGLFWRILGLNSINRRQGGKFAVLSVNHRLG
jgi:hypothetical protein